ncbi:Glyoxylase B2 [Penicillium subrubescens]|uniref:Glyoxylase B2 n=1 Tax=Penicillium subrubescens TaxID=1316194 RepID=A0A1Q5TDQ9_9EURO|nr:Glyoxylase B2 [Penicillium subrubescens]KAJ5906109.1 Glyoxylase B2 [Penicillium subrubescens]OKO98371.1 Glyoxylase B2 [Penicillium subrubescens]
MKSIRTHTSRRWSSAAGLRSTSSTSFIPCGQNISPHLQQGSRATYMTQRPQKTQSPFNKVSSISICRPKYSIGNIHPSRVHQHSTYSTNATTAKQPTIDNVFESNTGTWQYIVADPATSKAVLIDPVLDYDPCTQTITTTAADSLLALVKEKGYTIDRILETHAHADHLTASSYLQKQLTQTQGFKPPIGIGKRIEQVQKLFGQRYGLAKDEYLGVFDKLFDDDESFSVGELTAKAIHLPGHTPDHLGYQIGDNVFCGDTLFHADIGTARCDFPGGDAAHLFKSGRRLLSLEDHVKIWPGHDYPPEGRDPVPWMSVRDQREQNKHLRDVVSEREFVEMRTERDRGLSAPRLLHQSLQVNIRAGRLPRKEESGHRMLRLPLKLGGLDW